MPRQVQNLEGSVAEIDDISLLDDAGYRGWANSEASHVVVRGREGGQHRPCDLIAFDWRCEQGGDVGWIEFRPGERVLADWVAQPFGLARMHEAILELMMISDVVDVHMGCHGCHRSVENVLCELAETCNAQARINHKVAIAPAHMPDVAPQERHDMRFEDEGDVVIQPAKFKPSFGDFEHGLKRHGRRSEYPK